MTSAMRLTHEVATHRLCGFAKCGLLTFCSSYFPLDEAFERGLPSHLSTKEMLQFEAKAAIRASFLTSIIGIYVRKPFFRVFTQEMTDDHTLNVATKPKHPLSQNLFCRDQRHRRVQRKTTLLTHPRLRVQQGQSSIRNPRYSRRNWEQHN